jgi:lysophospholipase L1-like esterase
MTLGISVDELPEESFIEVGNQERINIEADYPISTIKVRLLRGSLNLDGLIPHYTKSPKLVIDNLAIPGATFKSWTTLVQPAGFKPSYDVAILAFGTNEGNNPKFDSATYQLDLQQGLTNFRRMYPGTACVLIGPTDRGILVAHHKRTKKGGRPQQPADLLKYAKVHAQISAIQASEASIAGCSFWDWQDAMGGIGSAYTWAYEKPPLMSKDLTHLTIPGYQKSARQFSSDFQLKSLLNP